RLAVPLDGRLPGRAPPRLPAGPDPRLAAPGPRGEPVGLHRRAPGVPGVARRGRSRGREGALMSMPTVLLTGAAGGIGRATALALASKGCRLGLIDRDSATLGEAEGEVATRGAAVASATADVTDPVGLPAAVRDLESRLGPFDVLIACAGIGGLTQVPDLDL